MVIAKQRLVCGNLFSFNDKQRHPLLFTYKDEKDLFFGGYSIEELKKFGINKVDLIPYMPIKANELENKELHVAKLPYYLNYNPQSNFIMQWNILVLKSIQWDEPRGHTQSIKV